MSEPEIVVNPREVQKLLKLSSTNTLEDSSTSEDQINVHFDNRVEIFHKKKYNFIL